MKPVLYFLCCICAAMPLAAEPDGTQQLTTRLEHFLTGASVNDAAVHDDFWHQNLTYTSSSGQRFGKEQLMQGVREAGSVAESDVTTWYSAENVSVRRFDNVAILNFTLVATTDENVQYYLNSGTFVHQNGKWQAINWQATKAAD